MDTSEWGNYNDEELHDLEEFDLEQYGFQYEGSLGVFSSFGDSSNFRIHA